MRVQKVFDPAKLHEELQAGGVPIVTVRAVFPEAGGPASHGVVVVEDKADMKILDSLIKAHKDTRSLSRQLDPKMVEYGLKQLERL